MISSDYRAEARRKLEGKWGKAALLVLAYIAIFFVLTMVANIIPVIGQIALLVIEIPLALGFTISLVKFFKGEEVGYFEFFKSGFDNFKKSWGITFQTILKLLVPIILFVVSYILIFVGAFGAIGTAATATSKAAAASAGSFGILTLLGVILLFVSMIWLVVASLYYELVNYVAAENPELSSKEVVEKSKELMTNKRWKFFCLQLSFIGWAILAGLTFGIGYLWLLPYMEFATIAFYKDALGTNVEVKPEVQ